MALYRSFPPVGPMGCEAHGLQSRPAVHRNLFYPGYKLYLSAQGGHKNGLMESRASLLARVGAAMSVLPPLVSPDAHSPPTVAKIGASPLDFWKTDTHWPDRRRPSPVGLAWHR